MRRTQAGVAADSEFIYWTFSAAAQSISAFVVFLLTGYAVVLSLMESRRARDESLADAHSELRLQLPSRPLPPGGADGPRHGAQPDGPVHQSLGLSGQVGARHLDGDPRRQPCALRARRGCFRELAEALRGAAAIDRAFYADLLDLNRYRNLVFQGQVTNADRVMVERVNAAIQQIEALLATRAPLKEAASAV